MFVNENLWEEVKKKLTIVIPVYNSEKTILKCISYLLPLAEKGVQILISDNFSNDSTREILKKFNDSRNIKIFYQQSNIGGESMLRLVKSVKTKYLLPIGSDDYLIDHANIPNTIKKLEDHSNAVACCFKSSFIYKEGYIFDRANIELTGTKEKRFTKFLRNVGANSRYYGIIRSDLFLKYYPRQSYFGDDVALSAKILSVGDWLYDEKIILHRERGISSDPFKLRKALGYTFLPPMRFAKEIIEYSSSKLSIIFWLSFFIYILKILIGPIKHIIITKKYEQ